MTVFLVGAGPGDPGLLTLRAADLLARADVVVHDRLIDSSTLALCRVDADLIDVGKSPGGHSTPLQSEINELLCRRGRTELVVRLKGGDPYLFGRGAEEATALAEAGVDHEVVPGVTSLVAVPELAGVALTRHGVTSTVVLATGHDPDGSGVASVDWAALGRTEATLVLAMAVAHRAAIAQRLIAAGRDRDTPVLVVERGASPEQHTTRTTLSELGALSVAPPATIVIGAVAAMQLAELEQRPLHGRIVALTRARKGADDLSTRLAAAGARVMEIPAIETVRLDASAAVVTAALASEPDWVICTSAAGVESLFGALRDARSIGRTRCAAVGPATAAAFAAHGVRVDLVAHRSDAAGLVESFPAPNPGGERIVYVRAARVEGDLGGALRDAGYLVEEIVAYETRAIDLDEDDARRVAAADVVVVSSPSALSALAAHLGRHAPVLVAIGPSTAAAIARSGRRVTVADSPNPDAVFAAVHEALFEVASGHR